MMSKEVLHEVTGFEGVLEVEVLLLLLVGMICVVVVAFY